MISHFDLENRFPSLPWREPIRVQRIDGLVRYACRFCIAQKGLKAKELEHQFQTPEAVTEHIQREHPVMKQ